MKDRFYNMIGFHKVGVFPFPTQLKNRMITNPDAPLSNYAIRLNYKGEDVWAVPLTISSTEKYDMERKGS